MKLCLLIVFFISIFTIPLLNQELPRFIDWHNAGLDNEITYKDSVYLSAANQSDFTTNLQDAINILPAKTLIIIRNGNYTITKAINLKSDIVIRGESSENTILTIENGNCFNLSGSLGKQVTYTELPKANSDTLITDEVLEIGEFIQVDIENGDWDTNPISWADRSQGQQFRIIAKPNETTYILDNKFKFHPDTSFEIRRFTPIQNVQISCLQMKREIQPTSVAYNISMNYAYNCKVNNIVSIKGDGAQVMLYNSFHCEVKNSYFTDAFEFNGSGTKGYGVTCASKTSYCKIENNVFKKLRHAMMVKQGANANVFAYNYSTEPNRSEPIADFSGDISVHGHFPFYNLFESNTVNNIIIDHYWGEAGYFNTFLRNRTENYGIITTTSDSQSKSQNFIGNESTKDIIFIDEYTVVGEDHLEIGNRTSAGFKQDTTGIHQYNSFLYPKFKPIIGSPVEYKSKKIDAELRFINNDLMNCEVNFTSVKSDKNNKLNSNKVIAVYNLLGIKVEVNSSDLDIIKKELEMGLYLVVTELETIKLLINE